MTQSGWDIQTRPCDIPTFPCQAQACVGYAANKLSKREARMICYLCAQQQLLPTGCSKFAGNHAQAPALSQQGTRKGREQVQLFDTCQHCPTCIDQTGSTSIQRHTPDRILYKALSETELQYFVLSKVYQGEIKFMHKSGAQSWNWGWAEPPVLHIPGRDVTESGVSRHCFLTVLSTIPPSLTQAQKNVDTTMDFHHLPPIKAAGHKALKSKFFPSYY